MKGGKKLKIRSVRSGSSLQGQSTTAPREPEPCCLQSLLTVMEPSEGPLQAEVLQQLPQPGALGDGEALLKGASIHGWAGVKERILVVPPALQPFLSLRERKSQDQGRKVVLERAMQCQALRFWQ